VAYGADAFASNHDDLVIFLRDGQAKVTKPAVRACWDLDWRRGRCARAN
jgi:hypothetical protein